MRIIVLQVFLSILLFLSCSDQTTNVPTDEQNGRIRMYLADSPMQLDSVIICVTSVEVHKSGSDTTSGWFTINDSTRYFDLLQLTNGASAVLGDTSLTPGHYTQIRLIISNSSYVIDQGVKHYLEIPSGSQSGLKLNHQFTIEEGNLYELLLDFNVDKSIVITGNGKYKLKPVIRVMPTVISGSISGQVLPIEAQPTIWTVYGTDTVTTFTNQQGFFKLIALPEGMYDVNIVPADTLVYRDSTLTGIQVFANQNTNIGTVNLETR